MRYEIISTGSKGNSLMINNEMLVDLGVPYNKIKEYNKKIKIVLLTHIHSLGSFQQSNN